MPNYRYQPQDCQRRPGCGCPPQMTKRQPDMAHAPEMSTRPGRSPTGASPWPMSPGSNERGILELEKAFTAEPSSRN